MNAIRPSVKIGESRTLDYYKYGTIIRKKTDNNGFAGFLDEMARVVGLDQDILEKSVK